MNRLRITFIDFQEVITNNNETGVKYITSFALRMNFPADADAVRDC